MGRLVEEWRGKVEAAARQRSMLSDDGPLFGKPRVLHGEARRLPGERHALHARQEATADRALEHVKAHLPAELEASLAEGPFAAMLAEGAEHQENTGTARRAIQPEAEASYQAALRDPRATAEERRALRRKARGR
jgi:hypothetical protein